MNGVVLSKSKAHLLEYVRSLWPYRGWRSGKTYRMGDLAQDSGQYLSALHNLHSLTLNGIKLEHISKDQFRTCFSAFRETLTSLSLANFATSFGVFVTLVAYFSNITTLELHSFVLEPDEGPVPPLSRPFRGELVVQADDLEFLDRFAQLDLEYEELAIESSSSMFWDAKLLESALRISTNTVKFLRFTAELRCESLLPCSSSESHPYRIFHFKPNS